MKKMGIVFENDKIHLARNICTVYSIEKKRNYGLEYKAIRLYNLCYIKATDEFALNKCIKLPKRIIAIYEGASHDINNKVKEMEAIGILNIDLLRKKLDLFKEDNDFISYSEYRNKLLNEPKKSLRFIEATEEISRLRKELIIIEKNV